MAIVTISTATENTTLDKGVISETVDNLSAAVVDGDNVREEALIADSFSDSSVFGGHDATHPYVDLTDGKVEHGRYITTASDLKDNTVSSPLLISFTDGSGDSLPMVTGSLRWHRYRSSVDLLTGAIVVRASCQIHWGPYVKNGFNFGLEYQRASGFLAPTEVAMMIRYSAENTDTFDADPNEWSWVDIPHTEQRFSMSWTSVTGASKINAGREVSTETSSLHDGPGNYSANFTYTGITAITSDTDGTSNSNISLNQVSGRYIRFGLFFDYINGATVVRSPFPAVDLADGAADANESLSFQLRSGTITATHITR